MSIDIEAIIVHSKIDFCIIPNPYAFEVSVALRIKGTDSMDYSYCYNNEDGMRNAAEDNQDIIKLVWEEAGPMEYFSDLLIIIS
jgi:hypothetical protein